MDTCVHLWTSGMMYVSDEDLDTIATNRAVTCETCDAVYKTDFQGGKLEMDTFDPEKGNFMDWLLND